MTGTITQAVARQHKQRAFNSRTSLEIILEHLLGGDVGPMDNLEVTLLTVDGMIGGDASLAIDGEAAAQGGAIVITGGTSSTAANAGGAVSVIGGVAGATGAGADVAVSAGAGGATSGVGGAVIVTAGSTTSGIVGQVHLRSGTDTPVLVKKAVAGTGADTEVLTVAELFNGIYLQTATAATTTTTPTGAAISAALGAGLAIGDSFEFIIINLGGTGDDITLTAGASGVTISGGAIVYPIADTPADHSNASGTFIFVNTASDTWIAYRK